MLVAGQSHDHLLPELKSSSGDDRCIPQKCFRIIGRCVYKNCGVHVIKRISNSLRSDDRSLEGNQSEGLHRLLKEKANNSKTRRRRSSYIYRDLIIDDGAQAWLQATGAERGQEKWQLEDSPTEDVLSEGLEKRGYNDISDLCMEFNCGEMAPGSIEYLKCVQDNRCAWSCLSSLRLKRNYQFWRTWGSSV